MDFGTLIFTKPERAISDVKYAEDRGFSHAWIPDSHMIWGDTYACMALAAVNTKKIKLGTGVAIATNRIPPVTVHSIATINQLAPGRVILGFGTGHTGRRVMGLPPVKQAEFREQVRVIRDLLLDGEATYNTEGLSRKIRYLHRDRRFINLDDRIPLYVAANGPKTLALAGEFGDGAITTGITDADRVGAVRKSLEAGASKVGRSADKMPIVSLTHICVLRPGEKLDSPRVLAMGLMSDTGAPSTVQTAVPATKPKYKSAELAEGESPAVASAAGSDVTLRVLENTLIGGQVSAQTNQLIHKQIGEQPAGANAIDTLNLLTALVMGSPEFQLR